MPSIVVINDEGSVLYQNVVEDVQDLVKIIRDGRNVPGYALEDCPEVRVNGRDARHRSVAQCGLPRSAR